MIHSISCKNFYSISEPVILDFVVNGNAPSNQGYFVAPSGTRLSKIETIIGPNASGKTNLLKLLPFVKFLIVDSFNLDPKHPMPLKPFLFNENENEPSLFSVVFESAGKIYTYDFLMDQTKILSEELSLTSKVKENKSTKKLFSRKWNEDTKSYLFEDKNFNLPKDFSSLLRTNASVVSVGVRLNHIESRSIVDVWKMLHTNVVEGGWAGDHLIPNSQVQLIESLNFYSEHKDLKEEAEKILRRFDLGFHALEIKKEDEKENEFTLDVKVVHSFNGSERFLPITYESAGTKQLLLLLRRILDVLVNGGVVVLDEIDVSLHPEMTEAIVSLFFHPDTNPHNAQIIFSTHNHRILSSLDKYQIILVEKNKFGSTEAWRLDEVGGVRPDDNYFAKYIAGEYGAVPNIK